jgi:4-amino-4-deoxy-L-arabinose transferase-like glycosyltransferase
MSYFTKPITDGIFGKFRTFLSLTDMPDYKIWQYNSAIGLIAALLFIPFLGGVHLFDWDEINFAESAREMITSGDYLTVQINYTPFWEKPPLFIWMQVLSMKIFGINEFAARFPNAVCGIISLPILFNIGRKIRDIRFGLIWVMMYAGSMLPFFYFKSGIIDPWFNLFIFLGIYQFYLYTERNERKALRSSGAALFIGLAILTKGPVALLIFALTAAIFILYKRFRVQIRTRDLLLFLGVLAITGGFWFILQIIRGNFNIITDFIIYQIRLLKTEDAGHGGFLLYHFVVLLVGVFPASIIALPSLLPSKSSFNKDHSFYVLLLILFWVVLILFTIVKTKIVHYSSLCYFPLTFLAAWTIYQIEQMSAMTKKIIFSLTLIVGISLIIIFTGIGYIDLFKGFLIAHKKITDPFTVAYLSADGGWKGHEFTAGLILLAGLLIFTRLWQKNKMEKAFICLTSAISVFMFLTLIMIVPRVEAYSQRSAIEFFESVSHENAYVETVGYKSYAHLFYGRSIDHNHSNSPDEKWLLTGNIDKPAYFAIKITRKEKFINDYPDVHYLYEKNGFVFFKRLPIFNKHNP